VLQEAVTLARGLPDAERAARRLAEEAYSRGSNDNISCVVIKFNF
jgi:protein phosphatase 1L